MSFKERAETAFVDYDDKQKFKFSMPRAKTAYSRDKQVHKSASIDIPEGITSDLQRTKGAYETPIAAESKSTIPRHLRKTTSVGGLNVPSKSNAVLRRWASLVSENAEDAAKRHSTPINEGSRGEKIVFRPVSSILLSTPWAKDFKGNESKDDAEDGQKDRDTGEANRRPGKDKVSVFYLNSCFTDQKDGPEEFSQLNAIKNHSLKTADKFTASNKHEDEYQAASSTNVPITVGHTNSPLQYQGSNEEDEKANYEKDRRTATPQRADYNQQIDKISIKPELFQQDINAVDLDTEHTAPEEMPVSTGSYFYKSKYGTDFSSFEPSFKRGTYTRRDPDTSYTSVSKIGRTLSAEKSGKETVAEVDAYISAYKSRRERSFEYGDTGYQSYIPTSSRTRRKTSFEKYTPLYTSQPSRSYPASYTSHYPTSNDVDSGRQRHEQVRTTEKDYGTRKLSRYFTKSDRSRSFDVEPSTYTSFSRTGSGGRYPRRSVTSSGSSTSSSRTYSPSERLYFDSSDAISSKDSSVGSILSSYVLTPSEKAFFSTSKIAETVPKTSAIGSNRSDYSKLHSSLSKDTPTKQRPLSLVGDSSRSMQLNSAYSYRRSATIDRDDETESSSRSRIMGGIISRFFTEDEQPKEAQETPKLARESLNEVEESPKEVHEPPKEAHEPPKKVHVEAEEPLRETQEPPKEPPASSIETTESSNVTDSTTPFAGEIVNDDSLSLRMNSQMPDGDSSDFTGSSPLMTSGDGNRFLSKSGQMVRVKSVLVEEGESATMGKDKEQKSMQKMKARSVDVAQGSRECKEVDNGQQQRERRSSWIGRSLRKISSPSKSATEEPLEKTEKPKRERRRSLLWRLGRDSKAAEITESAAADSKLQDDVSSVATSFDRKEEKGAKKEEKKEERKEEKKEGFVSYLRRSSRRKKSQVVEKEILETRQEIHVKSHEEINVIGTEIPTNSVEQSQLDTGVYESDKTAEIELLASDKRSKAPLAQGEDSEDDMASVNIRKSRFVEVLQKKEEAAAEAAKEIKHTVEQSKKIEMAAKKPGVKTTSNYLSSKFLKSRTIFEGVNEKSTSTGKKEKLIAKPGLRRHTQEPVDSRVGGEVVKTEVSKDQSSPNIRDKRALFQRSQTLDSTESSRIPLRERNKKLLGTTSIASKKDVNLKDVSNETNSKIMNGVSKAPVKRIVSDSIMKSCSTVKDEEVITHGKASEKNATKSEVDVQNHTNITENSVGISRETAEVNDDNLTDKEENKMTQLEGNNADKDLHKSEVEEKIESELTSKYLPTKLVANEDDYMNGSRMPLKMRLAQSLSSERKVELSSEIEVSEEAIKRDKEVGNRSEVNESQSDAHQKSPEGEFDDNELQSANNFNKETGSVLRDIDLNQTQEFSDTKPTDLTVIQPDVSSLSDTLSVMDTQDSEKDSAEGVGERSGSRRRRERRAHRVKQVDPIEIEKMKEQMRHDSTVKSEDIGDECKPVPQEEQIEKEPEREVEAHKISALPVLQLADGNEKEDERPLQIISGGNEEEHVKETGKIDKDEVKCVGEKKRDYLNDIIAVDSSLAETDTGDESTGSAGSATKLTTKSVIKEKIRQKKFDQQLRKQRTMSLPLGVEVVISPATERKDELEKPVNGTRSPLLKTKPPMMPRIKRSQEADDISKMQSKRRHPLRSRPKTLTQGIDPSLLVSDMKAKEEAVVVEERLSISQLKQRLMQSDSGSKTPRTPDVKEKKNKRRSGKRYKTITEGIAPSLLEAAQQFASGEKNPNLLGVEQMNRLNQALSASTENLKRRSFVVSEVNSRIESLGTSMTTSMEDVSMRGNAFNGEGRGSVVEESIKKLKKLPMVFDSDEDDPMPSVSSLKQKFLQAVEDSYKPVRSKISRRSKGKQRERPFTISGIDDITMRQLQLSIDERHEQERTETNTSPNHLDVEEVKGEKVDELPEEELEKMLADEGLTADQLASELGINPSLAQGSPLRSRKPFLGTTTEENAVDVVGAIEESSEKQEKETKSLGQLRSQFMNAMKEFRSGSFEKKEGEEEKKEDNEKKESETAIINKGERTPPKTEEESQPQSDLDFVTQNVTQLQSITDRRHLKPHRKQISSANPIKTLQARSDLITEVGSNTKTEVNKKVGKLDDKPQSSGLKLWRKVALANEAKAGLQSTEDFSKVKLRKVRAPGQTVNGEPSETGGVVESSITNLLIHIKGRRHVQIRIVDFTTNSLTDGDSFVIVTPRELLCWHGQNANVIEKAKATEIASRINQKKEMGCKAFDVVYVEQGGQNESKIFRTLDSQGKTIIKEDTEDDEEYERRMMNCSMVYRLQDSDPPELIPVYDMCQRSPSKDILKTDEVFVFDFMSEVYVWIGRQTTSGLRKKIMTLAREKFDRGYYKPPSATTPIHHGKSRKISLTATELPTRKQSISRKLSVHKFLHDKENLMPRPSHAVFLSMFEGAEWVIFKEKFCDWPDESRIIRMKGGPQTVGELAKKVEVADVKPVDPLTMVTPKLEPVLPSFEGTEIDRGQGKPKGPDGYHIVTRCVQIWHVTERSRTSLPQTSNGQFHSGEGYVIRWEYSVVASRLMKMLKDIEEAKASGRHRCAYFFWLGNDCAVTEQGATAVMTVDLDEERGPHVRVIQGKEPPCFLNLFDGGMVIHAGKRKSMMDRAIFSDRSVVRLYCVRNENPSEACLLQVPVCASSLRSRSSFVLVLCNQGEIFLWHGCKSTDSTRATAIQAAHRLIENHPEEALLAEKEQIFLTEIDEGNEPEVFWVALGGEDDYGSLLSDLNTKWDFVPRCFHLTSATGQFIANEILNPSICPAEACPFPFLQDDMYDAYQPAIFIIDAIHEVYLWLGWWPEEEDSENSDAQRMRWDVDKRKAMESVVLYAKEAGRSLSHCYVVDAGLEPPQFTHLFPYWIVQEDITDIQIEDGRIDSDKLQLITKKLEGFTREFFSIDELVQRPLPEGVNPSKLETYLSSEDFYDVFQMNRDVFKKLPVWRQDNLKKSVGLY